MTNDYQTEYRAIKDSVERFRWATATQLKVLVDELDIRASRLRGIDAEWDRRFRHSWEALEEVFAVMADRSMDTPDEALTKVVNNAVEQLKALLSESVPIQ